VSSATQSWQADVEADWLSPHPAKARESSAPRAHQLGPQFRGEIGHLLTVCVAAARLGVGGAKRSASMLAAQQQMLVRGHRPVGLAARNRPS